MVLAFVEDYFMGLSLRDEINVRLSNYLAGQDELSELHNWLIPATWDVDAEPEKVKRLAHRVQLLLAEYSNGHQSEEELRSALWNVLNRSSVTVVIGDASPFNGSTSSTQQVEMPALSVGTAHAEVYAC